MMAIRIIFWLIIVGVTVALIVNQYRKTGKPFPWIWAGFAVLVVVGVVLIRSCSGGPKDGSAGQPPPPTNSTPTTAQSVEALVLPPVYEGTTPCSFFIDSKVQIRVLGSYSIAIKFKGVQDPVVYPAGEGNFTAPSGVEIGEAYFTSPDPLRPNVRVQVYKKIIIQRP